LQAAMKARVLRVRTPNASAPRPYDHALVPALTPRATAPGLSWVLFKGAWPWLPDLRMLTPAKRGHSTGIDLSMLQEKESEAIAFEGYFHAPRDGEYDFTLKTDTGAMLFLHDIRVIAEPMRNPAGSFRGSALLQAGWHPLRLYYRHQGDHKPELQLVCTGPDREPLKLVEASFRQAADGAPWELNLN